MIEENKTKQLQDVIIEMVNKGHLYHEGKGERLHFKMTEEGKKHFEGWKYYKKYIESRGGIKSFIGMKCPICKHSFTENDIEYNTRGCIYDERYDKVICKECWSDYEKEIKKVVTIDK